jgi:hypothetical protein
MNLHKGSLGMNTHPVVCILRLRVSSKCFFFSLVSFHCDIRAFYRGTPKKGNIRELVYGYNVIAYFDEWDDRSRKHYLPSSVQKLLQAHLAEFFHE